MKDDFQRIIRELEQEVKSFQPKKEESNIGHILEIGDGIALCSGLSQAKMGEILEFPKETFGLVLNLKKENVGVIILGKYTHLKQDDEVKTTGRLLSIPVSEELLGRIINPLIHPLDGLSGLKTHRQSAKKEVKYMPLEKIAPGVIYRKSVDTPLQTGIKAIDSMIPIGRGQRELIIGDRGTGKTALAIDTIINQIPVTNHQPSVVCIYVAVGQKQSKVAQVVANLRKCGAMNYTIIVAANASDPPAFQYLAPYTGCAIGEYFLEKGKDALIIYDDLTKHAWAYRQLSLLLRRPSGREAYPGDIFYLHSRLLERACRLHEKYGGGSLTALPIIETQAGDVSAYIPTNVISITDGQIYLETDLFNAGIRPALNVGLSVSRVGGAAQIKAMKQIAGPLRLDLAQFRELAAFVQFGSELDPVTQKKLERGKRITEILKQPQYQPMLIQEQILIIWAVVNGYLDDIPVEKCHEFEERFILFVKKEHSHILQRIIEEKKLDENLIAKMEEAVKGFKENF